MLTLAATSGQPRRAALTHSLDGSKWPGRAIAERPPGFDRVTEVLDQTEAFFQRHLGG